MHKHKHNHHIKQSPQQAIRSKYNSNNTKPIPYSQLNIQPHTQHTYAPPQQHKHKQQHKQQQQYQHEQTYVEAQAEYGQDEDQDQGIPDEHCLKKINNNNMDSGRETMYQRQAKHEHQTHKQGHIQRLQHMGMQRQQADNHHVQQTQHISNYQTFNQDRHNPQSQHIPASNKPLTHGLTSYKEIKSALSLARESPNYLRSSQSRSGSKGKNKKLKLDSQYLNQTERQLAQCTFTPKTNMSKKMYKNFKDFVQSQQQFLNRKQAKIQKLKQQRDNKQNASFTAHPIIDSKSRKISELIDEYEIDSYGSVRRKEKRTPFHERLYNVPRKSERICTEETTFTPKILNKSKNMQRNGNVSALLYEDAQRRLGQQKLIQSKGYKEQTKHNTNNMHGYSLDKKTKRNNRLICNKIQSEFMQLLQTQFQQNGGNNKEGQMNNNGAISAILAVTIISQLFNVELDPNRNEPLCLQVIGHLMTPTQKQSDGDGKGEVSDSVRIKKLWQFIRAVVVGVDGYEGSMAMYSQQQVRRINQQLGYFYSMRLSKYPNRLLPQNQQLQYRIETSETTNKLAEMHRSKKLQQINQFLLCSDNNNMRDQVGNRKQPKNEANQNKDDKVLRLQDLFILDSIRYKKQLQHKKIIKEMEELKDCTFRPALNDKSLKKAQQRKSRSKDHPKKQRQDACVNNKRQPLKTQNNQKSKKIILKSRRGNREVEQGQQVSYKEIKDVDKTLLRLNLARKVKDVETVHKERGYSNYNSGNWLKEVREQKRQILQQVSLFLGYRDRHVPQDEQIHNHDDKPFQNYQSCRYK